MAIEKDWVRASLDLMVLSVLAEGANYGYEIQKHIRETSGHQVRLPGGTLYPLLHRLEAKGMIVGENREAGGQLRRWYRLTPAGVRRLEKQTDQWQRLTACLSRLLGRNDTFTATPDLTNDAAPEAT